MTFNLQEEIMATTRDMLSSKNYLEVRPNLFDPENEQKPL